MIAASNNNRAASRSVHSAAISLAAWRSSSTLSSARHEEHGLVFTGPDGTPLSPATVTRTFARHVRDAELPTLTLHGLRHTWATLALEAGIPSKIVAEVLGHTSARTTEDLYQHVTPGMQADATARVAALLRR